MSRHPRIRLLAGRLHAQILLLFYVGRPSVVLHDEAEVRAWIEGRERPWILGLRDDFERIGAGLPLVEIAADPPRRGAYVLIGRPDGQPPR